MTITLEGLLRAGPTPALAPESRNPAAPSEDFVSERTSLGWLLLRAAVGEVAAQSSDRAEAWIARFQPSRRGQAQAWSAYSQRVQESAPLLLGQLPALQQMAAEAPSGGSRVLHELASVLEENDPELFAEALISMAQRHLDRHPRFALAALQAAAGFSFTAERAQALLAASEGRGSFGAQFEIQAPRMLRDLSSPLMLASFGSGIFLGRAASLATLSRFGRLGWGSLVASEGAALAIEAPAMVLTHRAGARMFQGGAALFAPRELGHDILAAYGPFGMLRLSGNVLSLGGPWLRRNLALEGALGARVFSGLRFGAEIGSLALGHRFNGALGLEAPVSGAQLFYQSLLGAAHMRMAGRMVESLGWGSLGPVWEARRHELLRRNHQNISFGDGIDGGFAPAWAFAGRIGARPARSRAQVWEGPDLIFMTKHGEGGRSNPPGNGDGSGNGRSAPPSRKALILQLFSQNLGEYSQAAENQDTFLGRVARRLQDALAKPELIQDPSFAEALSEMESELDAVNDHSNIARRTYQQLKILLGRNGEEAELPSEVEQHVESIATDEAERGALTNSLSQMKEIFKTARQVGWSKDLYDRLVEAREQLTRLYRNSSSWKLPGFDRLLRRNDHEAMLQRRQGALLGLAVLNGYESATVRALRDPSASPNTPNGNVELELLHQSILTAARRPWEPAALEGEILVLAARFGATEDATMAMLSSAWAVRRLIEGGPKSTDLLEFLTERDEAQYFGDRWLHLRNLRGKSMEPGSALHQLTHGRQAADYWFTGLHLFLQSQGDPARLNQGLEVGRRSRLPGFHPSVAASLFGAAHGRKNLPQRLWSVELDPEEYLRRALEP